MIKTYEHLATISKEELIEKFGDVGPLQVVNVLAPEFYHLKSIIGSLKIPLAELEHRLNELDVSREVVTYCTHYESDTSREAAEKLSEYGFRVFVYEGGIQEWREADLPMEY